jgi:hypothetical protein
LICAVSMASTSPFSWATSASWSPVNLLTGRFQLLATETSESLVGYILGVDGIRPIRASRQGGSAPRERQRARNNCTAFHLAILPRFSVMRSGRDPVESVRGRTFAHQCAHAREGVTPGSADLPRLANPPLRRFPAHFAQQYARTREAWCRIGSTRMNSLNFDTPTRAVCPRTAAGWGHEPPLAPRDDSARGAAATGVLDNPVD